MQANSGRIPSNEIGVRRAGITRPWRLVAIVASMLMELTWMTLWYLVLFQSREAVSYWRAFAVLGFILFSSYLVAFRMDSPRIKPHVRRFALTFMSILSLVIGLKTLLYARQSTGLFALLNLPARTFRDIYNFLPSEFILMLLVLWTCWRGISRVGRLVSSEEAVRNFQIGVLMFLGYGLFSRWAHLSMGAEIYLFLFMGLLAMSSARISVVSYLRGGQRIPFDIRWITGLTVILMSMVSITAGIMHMAGSSGGNILARFVTWVIYAITLLLSPVLYLFLQLLLYLGRLLNLSEMIQGFVDLANRLQKLVETLTMQIENSLNTIDLPPLMARLVGSLYLLKPIALWGIILVFLGIIIMIARNQEFHERPQGDAVFERLDGEDGFLNQLRKSLRRALGSVADNFEHMLRQRNARNLLAAARIRRIYAQLMLLCERLDHPRPASRTPLEFLPNIEGLFPGFKEELSIITQAYLKVRYGDFPELSEDLSTVEAAWQRVSKVGNENVKKSKIIKNS